MTRQFHKMDWWSLKETRLPHTRYHVKLRYVLHTLARQWQALPKMNESRLTGHRKTQKNYFDGTTIVHTDENSRASSRRQVVDW